jgi:hypothetical protein
VSNIGDNLGQVILGVDAQSRIEILFTEQDFYDGARTQGLVIECNDKAARYGVNRRSSDSLDLGEQAAQPVSLRRSLLQFGDLDAKSAWSFVHEVRQDLLLSRQVDSGIN